MEHYILGIDQSTQGTKGLLFDRDGRVVFRVDRLHRQIVDAKGWVEHDPQEIWRNLQEIMQEILGKTGITGQEIAAIGISNQRETALAWNRATGKPVYNAIVWQCARGSAICEELQNQGKAKMVKEHTGLPLSPYFSAAKLAWILQNVPEAQKLMQTGNLCMGTIDSWLVYKLTHGREFRTDASNASRTQLFNIRNLLWDEELCGFFGIDCRALPAVCDSNALYGMTDFDGLLKNVVPIHAVFGDSHAALFGQGCHESGMVKATYGTGSSVMMNIGKKPIESCNGLATSLAWSLSGRTSYALEGNINYTGASVTWLQNELKLIRSASETAEMAENSNPADKSYFVPAFTGLGAPYWDSEATGLFTGITRMTGKNEIVRAVLDSIAYQIADIAELMQQESGKSIQVLCVDGGATKNRYLMQFQTDILAIPVEVPESEELSAMGAAYSAGIAIGFYDRQKIFAQVQRERYINRMAKERRQQLRDGWKTAVKRTLLKTELPDLTGMS
jgi:glycerol kinase